MYTINISALRPVVYALVLITTMALAAARAAAQTPVTQLSTTGDPGAFIGGDGPHTFTPADGPFSVTASGPAPGAPADSVEVRFASNDNKQFWELRFSTRQMGKPMSPGFYTRAQRDPFARPGHPGLDIDSNGSGCNTLTGSFIVFDATFDYSAPQIRLVSLAVQFEQHCEGQDPALRGTLFYGYPLPTTPLIFSDSVFPETQAGHPYAASLVSVGGTAPISWTIAGGQTAPGITLSLDGNLSGTPSQAGDFTFSIAATDALGHASQKQFSINVAPQTTLPPVSKLFLQGSPGGYVLGDTTVSLSPADGKFQALGDHTSVQIQFYGRNPADGVFWILSFSTNHLIRRDLTPGYFPDAMGTPFEAPGHPGIDVSGDGRGCNTETGNFTIIDSKLDFSLPDPVVLSFAAKFETHCEGAAPALTGYIYYNYEEPLQPTIANVSPFPEATLSQPYRETLIGAGGTAPYSYRLAGGTLPPGLSLHSNGQIDGTSTASGDFSSTLAITDSQGHTSQKSISLPVITPLTFTSPQTLPDATIARSYRATLTAAGGTAPYTFSFVTDGRSEMPDGLTLDPTGAVTGMPTMSSTFFALFRVTDAMSRTTDEVFRIRILTQDGKLGVRQLTMSSGEGDFVGAGFNYFYGDGDGDWHGSAYAPSFGASVTGVAINFDSPTQPGVFWTLSFSTGQSGTPLVPGSTYIGGAYIGGNGRGGCPNGDFTLLDARFDYSTGSPRIISFAARFDQQCGGTLRGLILFGSLPPAPGPHTPSITSAGFNHGKLTVRGDNFDAQCTLLVDGHQVTIDPRDPKNKLGPVIRVRGVSLQPGTHSIQVANVDGEVSASFSLDV